MYGNFHINSELFSLLEKQGYVDRVKTFSDEGGHISSFISEFELEDRIVPELKEEGFLKALAKEYPKLKEKLNEIYPTLTKRKINVGKSEQDLSLELFSLSIGYPGYFVLKPEEISSWQEQGFLSPIEMISSIGALVYSCQSIDSIDYKRGGKFQSEVNGEKRLTLVTGDINGDLRVQQRDETSYPQNLDMFGSKSRVRSSIQRTLAAYHSTEPQFLSLLIKYANENKLDLKFRDDWEKFKLDVNQGVNSEFNSRTAEQFDTCVDSMSVGYANGQICSNITLPTIDNFFQRRALIHRLAQESGLGYAALINSNNELAFGYTSEKGDFSEKYSIALEEVNPYITALVQQSANGGGRTNTATLVQILKDNK